MKRITRLQLCSWCEKKREFDSEESVQRGLYVPPLSVNFLSIKTIKKL